MVEKVGGKALYWPGDVSNSAQMKTMIDETVRQLGGIDIVVNSGGVRTNGSITDITEDDWDRTLDVNLERRVYRIPAGDPRDEKTRRRRDSSHCGALRDARSIGTRGILRLERRHGSFDRSDGDGPRQG